MKSRSTLRRRILLGAFLWTIGLVIVVSVIMATIFTHHPEVVAIHGMLMNHPLSLTVAFLTLLLGFWSVGRGLSPIAHLRERLVAVHRGEDKRVAGSYPAEVQPLVDDLNALLAQQEQTVQRAIAKAGDLAHGLKTPLAILRQEADRAAAGGHADLAAAIAQQVDRMRRQIDYQLAQARAAASGATAGVRSPLGECVDALVRTVEHLYADRQLRIDADVPAGSSVRVQREDLDEMLGNLLDNACKWGRTQVRVRAATTNAFVVIDVEDDGAGLAPGLRETVLQRGVRADEAAPGTGLGLAIVRELAELYGGGVTLDASDLGGLRARLRLPG
jgi:signal transduction histidine kinase